MIDLGDLDLVKPQRLSGMMEIITMEVHLIRMRMVAREEHIHGAADQSKEYYYSW